ncbi:MAG TPA: DsbA family protein [Steroidobacteraceae bacterium]|nr:DsbA family protein [Steroidobacteraceae bacterium]
MSGRSVVEFYYCCSCPWTYLAFVRLQETAVRAGAAIVFRPIVNAWLPHSAQQSLKALRHPTDPAAAAYAVKDLADWARFCGAPIHPERPWRGSPEWVQRGAIAAMQLGGIGPYAMAAFRAAHGEGLDLSGRAAVVALAAGCGLEGPEFESLLDSEDALEAVRHNTDRLRDRGGFGSPTAFLGEDMYFGHDRMPLLEAALMLGSDRRFIAPGEHGR